MALKVTALIKKNLTLLLRSKSSALIIIFGPLLLIVLLSAAFNTANAYAIIVGAYADEYSTLTNALIDGLEKKQMSIVHAESKNECIEGVRSGLFTVCAVFPRDLTVKKGGTVTFYVDQSRENFVYIVIESLTSEILKKSQQISEQLTTGVIETLSQSGDELEDKQLLLEASAKNSRDALDLVDKLHNNLGGLNITYTMDIFPFESLQAEVNELSAGSNASTAADQYIKTIQTRVEGVIEEISYVDSITDLAVRDLGHVRILVDENAGYVTVLDSSFDDVLRGIRGVKMQNVGTIVSPLDTKIESVVQEKTHLNYLFPTLVALIMMFIGLFLASSLEVRERKDRVYFKNIITPTSKLLFLIGNFLTNMLVILMQLVVLFLVALFFFKDQILNVLGGVVAIFLLAAGVFVLIGMVIGTLFKSEETSLVASLSIGFILLFFSSTILPVEALPDVMKNFVGYNPFYITQFLLSKTLLFHTSLGDMMMMIAILGGWFVGLLLLLVVSKELIPVE
jgi:ABC-2 type transport system permease protein